jgi:hypothetical protein
MTPVSRPTAFRLRPLSAALVLALGVGLLAALPAPADAARKAPGRTIGASTLGATIHWGYDVNDKGVGYAVWADGDAAKRRIFVAKRSVGGTWGRPRALTGTFTRKGKNSYSGYPDVAVDAKGRATVVWVQPARKGVVLKVATSKPNGWSKPRSLSAKQDYAGFPDVEVSDKGHAVVVWAGDFPFPPNNPFTLYAAYRDQKGSWSEPSRLDSQTPGYTLDARPESLAIDDRGVATVAWDEISDTGDRIQLATRDAGTGWGQTTLAQGSNLNAPAVSTTPDGHAVAAWRDFDGTLVSRRSPDGVWEAPQKVVAGPAGIAHNLFGLGISAPGRVALLGQEVVLSGNKVRPYVMVQEGPGQAWSREYVRAAFPQYGFSLFLPDLRMSRRGAVTVTWEQQPKSSSAWPRSFARTRTGNGKWRPVTQIGVRSSNPVIGVDGKGRFSVVFGEGGCCTSLRYASLGK